MPKNTNKAVSENVTNAMKEAFNEAREGNEAEHAIEDTQEAQALLPTDSNLPVAIESSTTLAFPNNETMQRALTQTANSIQYFAMNAIAWASGTVLTGFGEELDRDKFVQMLHINSSYKNYFTDGSDADNVTTGVDAPTDTEGHVALNNSSQMDSGTDKRKRLNAGAWKILEDNVERFEECVVIQKRLEGYGIVANQNLKDDNQQQPDGSFRLVEGVITKIIKAYNIKQAKNLAKWRAKQGDAVAVTAGAEDALATSMASTYDI